MTYKNNYLFRKMIFIKMSRKALTMRKIIVILLMIFVFTLSSCDGKDGASLLIDSGNPNSDFGEIGDSYIDKESWNYFLKDDSGWVLLGNLKSTEEIPHTGTDGLEFYPINDTECAVSAGTAQYLKEIVIPSKYKNYTVTTIDRGSAQYGTGFSDCWDLEKITLPDTITTIKPYAFANCQELRKITIPDSVTYIGETAFDNCISLEYNEFDNGCYLGNSNNPYVLFIKSKDRYIKTCEINVNTKFIYAYAFALCGDLKEIDIPKGVISIDKFAFADCINLENINISEGIDIIRYGTFLNCKSLKNIKIPNSVTTIETNVFSECNELTSIVISDKVTKIFEYAFSNCENLIIYCEVESEPDDWDLYWNRDQDVYWGAEWEYDEDGNPISIEK
jgi:hypothetical protein